MEDKAIRILDIIDCHNSLDDLNEETRDGIIGWITEILEDDLYTQDQVDKTIKEKEEELKTKYNKAIFNLTDSLNEKNDLLDWADKQLDNMANQIEKKDEIIRELSELLIKLSGKME